MQKTIKDFIKQRTESNPARPPAGGPAGESAGCFFKNPGWPEDKEDKKNFIGKFPELEKFSAQPRISAGFLIESVGLKGKKIYNAMISEKHANFIINGGNANAKDIIELANLIREKVRKRYGIDLENEVQLLGF